MDRNRITMRMFLIAGLMVVLVVLVCSCGSEKPTYQIIVKNGGLDRLTGLMLFFADRQYAQEIGDLDPGAKTEPALCSDGVPESAEFRWIAADGNIVSAKINVLGTIPKNTKGKVEFKIEDGNVSVRLIGAE